MGGTRLLAALAAVQFFLFSTLAFDPDSNSNLVVYWVCMYFPIIVKTAINSFDRVKALTRNA